MRHVTDGELHAYLDGALDLLGEGRGDEIREHLASCPVCAERLDDERGIRHQAQGILDETAPPEMELPPFEELRARAEAVTPGPGGQAEGSPPKPPAESGDDQVWKRIGTPFGGIPLGWAATVVLALGVGWMGGQVWRAVPEAPEREFSGDPTAAEVATTRQEEGEPPVAESRDEAAGATRVSSQAETGTPAADAVVRERVAGAEDPPHDRDVAEAVPYRTVFSEQTLEPQPALKGLAAPSQDETRLSVPGRSEEDGVTATVAPELLEAEGMEPDHSLALPGFDVLSVEWEEWIPGERALHIRQLLPMGDTLELRYVGMLMGTEPIPPTESQEGVATRGGAMLQHPPFPKVMEASLPPGWNQVVMKRGRGWLVARAPLTVEQLRALLRSFR